MDFTRHRPWEILESRNSLEKKFVSIYQKVAGEESMDLHYLGMGGQYHNMIPNGI